MEEYKYRAIVEWVKQYISDQKMRPNDRFLTEKELCEIHGVSRQTVRQALTKLERDGILSRVRGSGTFVKTAANNEQESGEKPSAGNTEEPDGGAGRIVQFRELLPGSASGAVKGTIGVVSTYFSDYIFPHIVTGIESVLNDSMCSMQLAITHNMVSEETQALEGMIAGGVSGLIVEPSKSALPNPNRRLYDRIREKNIPLVFFNAKYPWSDFPCVRLDDEAAGSIVTDYLFECGHTKISAIFALDDIQGPMRYSGFMKSCFEHGMRDAEKNVLWYVAAEKTELFDYAMTRLMGMISDSTAIVCYNDLMAVRLLTFCRENGINVPEDVSIVGIDDSSYSRICDVPLTTARHPHRALGESAARTLIRMMNGEKVSDVIFPPELVIRDSVKILGTTDKNRRPKRIG